jgi:hypothetical protein
VNATTNDHIEFAGIETQRTRPSFFGVMKVGGAQSGAPQGSRTLQRLGGRVPDFRTEKLAVVVRDRVGSSGRWSHVRVNVEVDLAMRVKTELAGKQLVKLGKKGCEVGALACRQVVTGETCSYLDSMMLAA